MHAEFLVNKGKKRCNNIQTNKQLILIFMGVFAGVREGGPFFCNAACGGVSGTTVLLEQREGGGRSHANLLKWHIPIMLADQRSVGIA